MIAIEIKDLPNWLYSSKKFRDAISKGETTIDYPESLIIHQSEHIVTIEDFENMINCCEYFEYGPSKYHMSIYAYYFMNIEYKSKKYEHLELKQEMKQEMRNSAMTYYALINNIEINSERWDLEILPIIYDISFFKFQEEFTLFSPILQDMEMPKDFNPFYLKLYFTFYDQLEIIFNNHSFRLCGIIQEYGLDNPNNANRPNYEDLEGVYLAKMIDSFLYLKEISRKLFCDKHPKGVKRVIAKRLLDENNFGPYSYQEYHLNLFEKAMKLFDWIAKISNPNDVPLPPYLSPEEWITFKRQLREIGENNLDLTIDFAHFFHFESSKYYQDALKICT